MKKRLLASLLAAGMMAGLLTGCSSSADSADEKGNSTAAETIANSPQADTTTTKGPENYDQSQIGDHVFIYGHVGADGCSCDVPGDVLNELLSQKTNGKMRVEVYYSGQLGTDASMMSDIQSASLDFYSSNMSNFQSSIPEMAAFDMPFFYDNWEELDMYLNYNDDLFEQVAPMFYEAGYKLLPWQAAGWREISNNVQITGIDSFKGLRMRIPVIDSYIAVFESLGSAPTAINSSELFLALQQKMVDGQENPYDQIYTYGFGEVQKYVTNSNHLQYLNQVVMSAKMWESLNEEEQKVVWDAALEMAESVKNWNKEAQDYYLDALQKDYGMQFINFDEIDGLRDALREKSMKYCYEKIKASIEKKGGDPAFLDEYIKMRGFEIPA